MRFLFEIFRQTLSTLWAHKLRSFLTMFGVAWGVGSLVLLVGVGEGFRTGNQRELDQIGRDIIFIWGGRIPAVPGSFTSMKPFNVTWQDYLDIRDEARLVKRVAPVLSRRDIQVVSEYTSAGGEVMGVLAHYDQIRYLPVERGRWLNELDIEQRRHVAVVGHEMLGKLFPGRDPVGETLLLNGLRFHVVGILKQVGQEEDNGTNVRLFIPFNTMRTYFPLTEEGAENRLTYINYQPVTREAHDAAKWQVRQIVARNHGGFDYHVEEAWGDWDTVESSKVIGKIFSAMNWFLGGVGLVTLALGAIGIINIMLVSVTERTREIGLRKALGATRRSILLQFFFEGAFLTLLSGGLGLGTAALIMHLLSGLPAPSGFDPPKLLPWTATMALLSLSLAGMAAGLYPARKAAMLTPVEALRQE